MNNTFKLTRQAALELRELATSKHELTGRNLMLLDALRTWEVGAKVAFHSYGNEVQEGHYVASCGGVCLIGAAMCGDPEAAPLTCDREEAMVMAAAAKYGLARNDVSSIARGFDRSGQDNMWFERVGSNPSMWDFGMLVGNIVRGYGAWRQVKNACRRLLPGQRGLASDPRYAGPETQRLRRQLLTSEARAEVTEA